MDNVRELKVLVKYLPDQNSLKSFETINKALALGFQNNLQKVFDKLKVNVNVSGNSKAMQGAFTVGALNVASNLQNSVNKAFQNNAKVLSAKDNQTVKAIVDQKIALENKLSELNKSISKISDPSTYTKAYSKAGASPELAMHLGTKDAELFEESAKAKQKQIQDQINAKAKEELDVKQRINKAQDYLNAKVEKQKLAQSKMLEQQKKIQEIQQKMSSTAKYGFLAVNALMMRTAIEGLEQYRTMADGATRVNAYFTNAVLYNNRKLSRDQAMQIAGKQVLSYQKRLEDLASKSLTPIHELNQAFGQLASFQITGDMMDSRFMESVSDYFAGARAAGKDVNILTDINRLGKAIQLGHDTLSEYGITMDDNQKKMLKTLPVQKRVALMTQILKQNTAGFVDELKKTDLGKMIIAQNKYKLAIAKTGQIYARMKTSLLEIGTATLPATNGLLRIYEAILGTVNAVTGFISAKIPEKLQNFIGAFGGITLGIISMYNAWKLLSKVMISWKFVAVAAAIALVVIALEDLYRYFKDPSANTFTKKVVEWYKALSPIGKTLVWIAGAFAGVIASLLVFNKVSALITGISTVFSALSGVFAVLSIKAILIGGAIALIAGAVYYVNKVVQEKFGGWINMFGEIYEWLSQFSAFNFIVDNLKATYEIITKMLKGDFTGAFQVFADRITEIFTAIPEKISGAWSWIKNKFSGVVQNANVDYSGISFIPNGQYDTSGNFNSDRFNLNSNGKVTTNNVTLNPSITIDGAKNPEETARLVRLELNKFMEDSSITLGY